MTSPKPARRRKASRLRVAIQQMAHAAGLPAPAYQTAGAAGLDLLAAVPERTPMVLAPGRHALVPTGLRLALPYGHEAQVRPRSGLALKHGVTVLNSPGTIDADYRGEVQVLLINHGQQPFEIRRGERIAQMVVQQVTQAILVVRDTLDETERGAGGFGSTGKTTPARVAGPAAKKRAGAPKRTPVRR